MGRERGESGNPSTTLAEVEGVVGGELSSDFSLQSKARCGMSDGVRRVLGLAACSVCPSHPNTFKPHTWGI